MDRKTPPSVMAVRRGVGLVKGGSFSTRNDTPLSTYVMCHPQLARFLLKNRVKQSRALSTTDNPHLGDRQVVGTRA